MSWRFVHRRTFRRQPAPELRARERRPPHSTDHPAGQRPVLHHLQLRELVPQGNEILFSAHAPAPTGARSGPFTPTAASMQTPAAGRAARPAAGDEAQLSVEERGTGARTGAQRGNSRVGALEQAVQAQSRTRLENRFGPLGPTRVQIPPPPLYQAETQPARQVSASQRIGSRLTAWLPTRMISGTRGRRT
jgi:hypothetical protein